MTNTDPKKTKWNFYQLLIVLLLGSFIVFSLWSAKQASTNGTNVTDSDYYSKGLKYTETLVEKRAASVLGWQVETSLAGRTLQVSLLDKEQKTVTGASGFVELYFDASGTTTVLKLLEAGLGQYRVDIPNTISGEVRTRIELERDGAKIFRQVLLNI